MGGWGQGGGLRYASLSTRFAEDAMTRGLLPNKRLMWSCRWMGSHFHDWADKSGVAFSIELLEWGRTFSDFCGKTVFLIYG